MRFSVSEDVQRAGEEVGQGTATPGEQRREQETGRTLRLRGVLQRNASVQQEEVQQTVSDRFTPNKTSLGHRVAG